MTLRYSVLENLIQTTSYRKCMRNACAIITLSIVKMFQTKGKEPAAFSINHNIISSCLEVLGAFPQIICPVSTANTETCPYSCPSEPHWICKLNPVLHVDARGRVDIPLAVMAIAAVARGAFSLGPSSQRELLAGKIDPLVSSTGASSGCISTWGTTSSTPLVAQALLENEGLCRGGSGRKADSGT